jgi:hypothetical protein
MARVGPPLTTDKTCVAYAMSCAYLNQAMIIMSCVNRKLRPTLTAACDHVDCVRYLIALLSLVFPSIDNTSPDGNVA